MPTSAKTRTAPLETILIATIAESRVIGSRERVLWTPPVETKHFAVLTMGCPVIMGRRTWESIGAKPLRYSLTVVVSETLEREMEHPGKRKAMGVRAPGYPDAVYGTLDAALNALSAESAAFLIGGEDLFSRALNNDLVDRLELTRIHSAVGGDMRLPKFEDKFSIVKSHQYKSSSGTQISLESWFRIGERQ